MNIPVEGGLPVRAAESVPPLEPDHAPPAEGRSALRALIGTPESRRAEGKANGWWDMVDSWNPAAVAEFAAQGLEPQMVAGYPVKCGQGIFTADGAITGWETADFQNFLEQGIGIVRIANMTPDWHCCSIADVEAGAITYPGARQFVSGRESLHRGTSTVYASLDNWAAVGRACRGAEPSWAWVADWPQYPNLLEISQIRTVLAQVCPGTELAAIQYRNLPAPNVDLSVVISARWERYA